MALRKVAYLQFTRGLLPVVLRLMFLLVAAWGSGLGLVWGGG